MTQHAISPFRIVILDSPIDTWDDPRTRQLFNKIVSMKIHGYGREYPPGVITLDTTDYIGTHLMVCREDREGNLEPLVGYRSIALSRCQFHHLDFPAFGTLRSSGVPEVGEKVSEILNSCAERGVDISYDSSWTRSQEVAENHDLAKYLRGIIATIGVHFHLNTPTPEWIVCGAVRFKTHDFFKWFGGYEITQPFPQKSLAGAEAVMLHVKDYTRESIEAAKQHLDLWENRLVIARSKEEKIKKAS